MGFGDYLQLVEDGARMAIVAAVLAAILVVLVIALLVQVGHLRAELRDFRRHVYRPRTPADDPAPPPRSGW